MTVQEVDREKSANQDGVNDLENDIPAKEQESKQESGKIEQLESQLLDMADRLQKQSAIIGKLTNEKKSHEPKPEKDENKKEKAGDVSHYKQLEEKLDVFQRRIEKQEKAATLSEIELSLVEAGASPQLAKEQAEFFAFKLGDRILSEESEAGEITRSVTDTNGEPVTMAQWAKAYIESDSGSYLRAGKTGPSVKNKGNAEGNVGKIKLKSADYSRAYSEAHAQGKEAVEAFIATHSML